MLRILSASQMAKADKYTIEKRHIPALVLMERAALSVCEEIEHILPIGGKVGVLCGVGNNGGDGLAIVRILKEKGCEVSYSILGDKLKASDSTKAQMKILYAYDYVPVDNYKLLKGCDLIIDALFGTGLKRDLDEYFKKVIDDVNSWSAIKLSVDIPSGINATNGKAMNAAFKADITVTFAFSMIGHHLYPGKDYRGNLIIKDIGIPASNINPNESVIGAITKDELVFMLPPRINNSHKGTYGRLLVIAGDTGMAGAAYLAAKAAYCSGTGLVKILTKEDNRAILQGLIPEAMVSTYTDSCPVDMLKEELAWADAILIGPGMGISDDSKALVESVIKQSNVGIVIDADGLNNLSDNTHILKESKAPIIITPHIGEMSRLTKASKEQIMDDLIETTREFSDKYKVTTILKSASTIISVPEDNTYINLYGNNGMSTGGSGDVLSGIIAGLLAQKMTAGEAAIIGTCIHSLAGDEAASYIGKRAMNAKDIIEGLILLLKKLEDEEIARRD